MQFRPPPMLLAFPSTWHLVAWVVGLATILALPVLTTYTVNPQTRYLVMSKRVGPTDWHVNQILKETEPLDVLFVGNSRILAAVDHAALQQELQRRGRHLATATIGAQLEAEDLAFTYLRDFFARRRARLVIVQSPEIEFPQLDTNPSTKYIRSLVRPDPGLYFSTLALATVEYGEMVMIAPRLLLASIIPPGPIVQGVFNFRSETADLEKTRGAIAPDWGYQDPGPGAAPRAPFIKSALADTPLPALLIRPGAPIPPGVVLVDRPLTPIEGVYLPAIKKLCDQNGAMLALMNEPFANRQDPDTVEVPRQLVALGIPIIVETRNCMFGKTPEETILQYYSDYFHFNSNGAREGAKVYAPAIETLLGQKGAG